MRGMKANLTPENVTSAVKEAVQGYLLARANAEVMREKVNQVYREVLEIHPLYTDFMAERREEIKRVTDVEDMYLSTDEATCGEVYRDANLTLREMGLKSDDMPDEHCPALVAEELQRDTEHLILEASSDMLELDFNGHELKHRLLCLGLEKYKKFIDLVVGLVVNLPDFKGVRI